MHFNHLKISSKKKLTKIVFESFLFAKLMNKTIMSYLYNLHHPNNSSSYLQRTICKFQKNVSSGFYQEFFLFVKSIFGVTLFLPLLLMSLQSVSCSSVSSCLLSRSLNSSMGRLMMSLQVMGRPIACAFRSSLPFPGIY